MILMAPAGPVPRGSAAATRPTTSCYCP